MQADIRWKQRFDNFERAYLLLKSGLEEKPFDAFSMLEKEGIIQRFEYSYDLAWKVLKDYLEHTGVVLEQITPRDVIKKAFAANIIPDGKIWIAMVEHRNLMSHTYSQKAFETVIDAIRHHYVDVLEQLFVSFKAKSQEL